MNSICTMRWQEQQETCPARGRHILAAFDDRSVVVYQAFRPEIARYAVEHGAFGGPFGMNRMSWIKPSFLWMMDRSGWGTKKDQEVTLAVRLSREGFDTILAAAIPSSFVPQLYDTREAWAADVARSDVRLQWDPDRGPAGAPLERRAVQLGLRRGALASYAREWIVEISDVSAFVAEERGKDRTVLRTPRERVYPVADPAVIRRLGLDPI